MQRKVVFINLRLMGGGSERVMAMIASYFADSGIDTDMILMEDRERIYKVSDKVNIIECYCPMEKNKLLWHLKRVYSLRKAIKQSNADTVISFMWDINLKVLLATLGMNKKVIISERADPNNVSRKRNMKFAQKWIFPMADIAVFQTEQVMKSYPEKIQKKGIIIPNPISKISVDENINKEKTIIAAGRLYEQKNYKMLIKAFKEFSAIHPEYVLKIFGEGELRKTLEDMTRKYGLDDKVLFPGFVKNIKEEMNKASIYACSSNYEGISNSMLEAMSIGLPSVCTDCPVGGAAMVIKDHINGILVPVNDYSAMAKAFIEIADNEQLSKSLSIESKKILEQYSIDKIGKMWIEL